MKMEPDNKISDNPSSNGHLQIAILKLNNTIALESTDTANTTTVPDKIVSLRLGEDINIIKELNKKLDVLNVSLISLSRCALTCLPFSFDFPNLKTLNLSHNKFSDVPACLQYELKTLEHLDLSHNKIGTILNEPLCASNLKFLNVEDNLLTSFPVWITEVRTRNLEHFNFSKNKISKIKDIYYLCHGSYKLKKLELRNCYLLREDFLFLKNIRPLLDLDISNELNTHDSNVFFDIEFLFEKPLWGDTLIKLNINNIGVSVLAENISKIKNMQELHVVGNNLSWLPESITDLKYLKILDLSKNDLISLPKSFDKLENLEVLKVAFNRLWKCPDISSKKLSHLDLYKNQIESFDYDITSIDCIDLEENLFDTATILESFKYNEKKAALRLHTDIRNDGLLYDEKTEDPDCYFETSSENDLECDSPDVSVINHEDAEEFWGVDESSSVDEKDNVDNNECTTADNNWLGYEIPVQCKKAPQKKLEQLPDYLFEDV